MSTRTLVKSAPQSSNFKVWDEPTPLAQINDYIRQSFAPVMQVIDKDTLCDGQVWLLVKPISASYTEEWVIDPEPIVEQQPTPAPSEDIEAAQTIGFAGNVTSDRLPSNGEAIAPGDNANAEYESGCTHGKFDAASRMPPICTEASCPYSLGYLNAYHSFLVARQQAPQNSKPIGWSVVHNPKWDVYQVWIAERCLQQKAISYQEAERIAQILHHSQQGLAKGSKTWKKGRRNKLS